MKELHGCLVNGIITIFCMMVCWMPMEVYAAEEIFPYTFGNVVTVQGDYGADSYTFSINKRTQIKLSVSVLDDGSATKKSRLEFQFVRKDKYGGYSTGLTEREQYDYTKSSYVYEGKTEEIVINFQPGEYCLRISDMSNATYSFVMHLLSQTEAPINVSPMTKNGGIYVDYQLGTIFSLHNYQYDNEIIYYKFSVPYRTQYDLNVTVNKNEYYTYSSDYISSSDYRDRLYVITKERYEEGIYGVQLHGISDAEYSSYIDPGNTKTSSITLEKGEYYLVHDTGFCSEDFTLCLKQGNQNATSIKLEENRHTMEKRDTYQLNVSTYPEQGTALVTYKSSNPKIATVDANGLVTPVAKKGKVNITAYLQNGASATCKITIKEVLLTTKISSQVGYNCYHNKNFVYIDHDIENTLYSNAKKTFKIYRSTKKNGKYKYIGKKTVKGKEWILYKDKKVKPNKTYYYKVKVRIHGLGGYNDNDEYGPLSKPVAYRTAPNPYVDFSVKNRTLTWKKTKGATVYLVMEEWVEHLGYNIFGRSVYGHSLEHEMITKTSYTVGGDYDVDVGVIAGAKHGKYYYISGFPVSKKKSDFEDSKYNKTVS